MKLPRWLPYAGIVAFYVTLVVLGRMWLRPSFAENRQSERAAITKRWSAVNARVLAENHRLRELVVRDSLVGLLPRAPGVYISGLDDRIDVVVNVRGSEPSIQPASLRSLVLREAGASPRVSVNVIGVPIGYGDHPEVRDYYVTRMFFSGHLDGRPYCVAAVPVTQPVLRRHQAAMITRAGILGPCAFWSRYGAAGVSIQEWLESGGRHFAGSAEFGSGGFDEWRESRFRLPIRGQACLAGRLEACTEAVVNPLGMYHRSDAAWYFSEWETYLVPGERILLIALEREFGAARFRQFWTSDLPFEVAFLDAFGTDVGTWVRKWLQPYGRIERGAHLGGRSIFLTLLFLGVCVGFVLATAQRRRV